MGAQKLTTECTRKSVRNDSDRALLLQRLGGLRKKLLDLSNRNRLLNFKHSDRSRTHVRIIDELPDVLFQRLRDQKSLRFKSLPEPESEPEDERTPHFLRELEVARATDPDYKAAMDEMSEEDSDTERAAKFERDLKDRLRQRLSMPPWRDETVLSKADFARKYSIEPSYDLPLPTNDGNDAERHLDDEIQTLLYPREMDRKLSGIVDQARTMLQEAGVNTLYAAFGFLEWAEADKSDTVHQSPLLLLPVQIERRMSKPWRRYSLRCEASDIEVNRTLRLRLGNEFGFELPKFDADETPESFLRKVSEHVAARHGWRVRRFVTIGNFGFSKLAMFDDLDMSNWPETHALEDHPQFGDLLLGKEDDGSGAIFAPDYEIDTPEADGAPVHLVADADASQHSAVIDVVNGKSIVIKGPPGTGKSQTITNIITSLIAGGKRVLFVAEKMAALDVVYSRLRDAELEEFCLEVHSNKTSKVSVLNSIKARLAIQETVPQPARFDDKIAELRSCRDKLNSCAGALNQSFSKLELTAHEILWGELRSKSDADAKCISAIEDIYLDNVTDLTPLARSHKRAELRDTFEHLSHIIEEFDTVADHPWCWIGATQLDPFKQKEATKQAEQWKDSLTELEAEVSEIAGTWDLADVSTIADVEHIYAAIQLVPQPPSQNVTAIASIIARRDLARSVHSLLEWHDSEGQVQRAPTVFEKPTIPAQENWVDVNTRIVTAQELLVSHAADLPDVSAVTAYAGELRAAIGYVQRAMELARFAIESAGLEFTGNPSAIIEALTTLQLLGDVDESLLDLRCSSLLERDARHHLEQAALKSEELRNLRSEIEEYYVLKPLPDLRQVSSHVRSLRSAGRVGWLRSDVRAANSFVREISVSRQKVDSETAISRLSRLESFLDDLSLFEKNENLVSICGSRFVGVETKFADFLAIHDWVANVRQAFVQQTLQAASLRKLLLEGEVEQLLDLKLRASGYSIEDAIVEIEELALDWDNLSEAVRSIVARADELEGACMILNGLGFSPSAKFIDVSAYGKCLAELEPIRFELQASGAHAIARGISISSLEEAIAYIDALDELKLSRRVRSELLQSDAEGTFKSLRMFGAQLRGLLDKNERIQAALFEVLAATPEMLNELSILGWIETLDRALKHVASLAPWIKFQAALAQVSSDGLHEVVRSLVEVAPPVENSIAAYDWAVFRSLARALYEAHPYLAKIDGLSTDALRERFQELDIEILKLEQQKIRSQLCHASLPRGNGVGRKSTYSELHLIRNELGKKSRHVPLRDLFTRAAGAIQQMKPCFMMSPLSVATYLPPGKIDFDVIVMDEASQLPLEDALGAIGRAGQCVIVGDNMQLPPTSFFRRFDDAIEGEDEEEDEDLDVESVLDQGFNVFFPPRELRWHYRSHHQSLIAFSNKHFYENRLTVFPSCLETHPEYGVELVEVGGVYGKSENAKEVEAVGKWAVEFMRSNPNRSLGIVAINQLQRDLINDEMDRLSQVLPEVELYRKKWDGGLYPFFVKNLENVQGDERDVIAVSTVYGHNVDGKMAQNFGPISRKHGHRRLNVLFTRARRQLILFTSLKPDDVQLRETTGFGPRALRNYLEYAKTGRLDPGEETGLEPDSDFEIEVANRLAGAGYEAVPQVGVAGFRVDIGIRHPDFPSMFLIGVECDGATYHSAKSARDRDRLREEVLRGQGWQLYRVWSTDWFRDADAETRKLITFIEMCASDRRRQMEEDARQVSEVGPNGPVPDDERAVMDVLSNEITPDIDILSDETDAVDELFQSIDGERTVETTVEPASIGPVCEVGDEIIFHYEDRPNDMLIVTLAIGESEPSHGIVSYLSPIGEALNGVAEGEDAEVYLADSTRTIIIDKVTKQKSRHWPKQDQQTEMEMGEAEGPLFDKPDDATQLSHYRTWQPRQLPDPRNAGQHKIAQALEEIINTEGPIRANRLYRVYAHACGIARVGRVVRQHFDDALKALERTQRVQVENEGPSESEFDYRVVRLRETPSVIVRTGNSRDFWEVPPSELGTILADERQARPSANDETIFRDVIAKYGVSRLTRNIEAELKRIERDFAQSQ